jgi:lysyl-tRNA synthetase class 2
MELSELQEIRRQKAEILRERGEQPYPTRTSRTHTSEQALATYEADIADGSEESTSVVTVAGRLVSFRHMGKTIFAHVRDGYGELQLYIRKDVIGEDAYADVLKLYDLGDFVEATGTLFRTKTGEVSLRAGNLTMLAKALTAPPEKYHGLQDIEARYRQRYADLIANEESRRVFLVRSKIVTALRTFLNARDYIEVETPVLQPLYGGAAARPFTTYHNALQQTFYLRIADELYLKRLLVGGFERVYEIAKDFRNEGVDRNHSPEFTMLEFYEAYADYESMMRLVEEMIFFVTKEALGEPVIRYREHVIDVTPPWTRKTLRQAIIDGSGIDYLEHPTQPELLAAARKAGADIASDMVWPRIVDELLKQFVRPFLIEPTFLIDYPVELSPLAKRKPSDPTHAERFQYYIGGIESGNAFTELNDPLDQLARFMEQEKDKDAGDEDAMPIDLDFINALTYGMPPTGGVGIGIDRMTGLLTDQHTVRDVILFPAMRNLPAGTTGAGEDAESDAETESN